GERPAADAAADRRANAADDDTLDPEEDAGPDTAGQMPRLEDSAAAAAARDSALEAAMRRATLNVMGTRTLSSASSRMQSYDRRRTSGLERSNRFAVEIQKKYSIPAACVVFVLIGAPLAVRFREAGVAMVVGLSLAFFCAYYVSLVGGEELADRLILSPFWAMWLPNVLFGGIGIYLVRRGVKVG
ncbi:MAG: LptF/LptG family permease, partial [Gemmatimonadota bacterium]